jgi:hypothetical protein
MGVAATAVAIQTVAFDETLPGMHHSCHSASLQHLLLMVHGVPEHPDVLDAAIWAKQLHLQRLYLIGILVLLVDDATAPVCEACVLLH